jgi:hypothetical protein
MCDSPLSSSLALLTAIVATIPGCAPATEQPPVANEGADLAICLLADDFVSEGEVPLDARAAGNAASIAALRWEAHEGCERFVVDLTTDEGAPASMAGRVTAEVLRGRGVVRVHLRDMERVATDATDQHFDGQLARAAYAVRAPDGGGMYVDLHLAAEAEAAVNLLDDPARVVVDLRPGGGAIPDPPAAHPRVVVLEPRPGERAYPLTVSGYARTFEANVVMRLERDGEEYLEDFTTSTGWVDAWGAYSFTIEDGPTGDLDLHVGEYSAKDGSWDGVEIPLRITTGP